jgi:sortase A
MTRRALRLGLALLLGLAAFDGGRAAWIIVKAHLAQHLVRAAWEESRAEARDVRPWPWADTYPVARLRVLSRRVDLFVLDGASGRTLAFGPGHVSGTPLPGERGNSVVAGHRDTHFAFLRRLVPGDALDVETRDGRTRRFVVSATRVVDRKELSVVADAGDTRLTLVTCYPFFAPVAGGPLRYVVTARLAQPGT